MSPDKSNSSSLPWKRNFSWREYEQQHTVIGTTHWPTPVEPLDRNCVCKRRPISKPLSQRLKLILKAERWKLQNVHDFVSKKKTKKHNTYLLQL
jgi:hypothetical protein